jgi:hypothetical protein
MQVLDQMDSIAGLYDKDSLTDTCSSWTEYATANGVNQMRLDDDGI